MRLYTATLMSNTLVRANLFLLELYAPQLIQNITSGQYCMLRCCPLQALDPLLRRPFFIHGIRRERGSCTILVHVRGRGTTWLVQQPEGSQIEMQGPLGNSWTVRPTTRNLLLVSEGELISPLPLLAQMALEKEVAVTLVSQVATEDKAYPPALFSPEVEYHIVTEDTSFGQKGGLVETLGPYLQWADAAYCSVSRETVIILYNQFERLRGKHFAQCTHLQPLVCGVGACLACSIDTYSGQKLVCRDGPVFAMRDLAR